MKQCTYSVLQSGTIKKIDIDEKEYFIPPDAGNVDYQAYLEHLTENPTAEA